jgi:hypothetical protein
VRRDRERHDVDALVEQIPRLLERGHAADVPVRRASAGNALPTFSVFNRMKSTMSWSVGLSLPSVCAGLTFATFGRPSRAGSPLPILAVSSFSTPDLLHTGHEISPAAFWPSKSREDANQPSKR